jgi:hypothetical protein
MTNEIHPRVKIVNEARHTLDVALGTWLKKHDLTTAEGVMILTAAFNGLIVGAMRLAVKKEREIGNDASPDFPS